jgi:hypothetical protein
MPDVSPSSTAPAARGWRGRAIVWLGVVIAGLASQFAFPCTLTDVGGSPFVTIVLAVGVPGLFVLRLAPLPRRRWARLAALAALGAFTAFACAGNLLMHVCM